MTSDLERTILSTKWFYRFKLPCGETTQIYIPDEIALIHDTREQMMLSVLQRTLGDDWTRLRCIDLACHQGYFAQTLAARGCQEVIGIDARDENIADATLIRDALGASNAHFHVQNLYDIDAAQMGRFDVVLMFGLLYHVEDPIGALRIARQLTRRVCLVETQIAPSVDAEMDWGTRHYRKQIKGTLAIIDEMQEAQSGNREASLTSGLSLVPSLDAVRYLMECFGFRTEVLPCPPGGYEQLASGSRAIIAGFVDDHHAAGLAAQPETATQTGCPVCGGADLSRVDVLWPALIDAWGLAPDDVAMINRQQGECCTQCGSSLRSRTLAGALLQTLNWRGTLAQLVDSPLTRQHRLLEINEAGHLHPQLQKWPNYQFAAFPDVDMLRLPYPDNSFDLVIHSDTLEHVSDPVQALRECHRVLRPGGRMLMTIPIVHNRITRRRDDLPDSFHGNSGNRDSDMKVITEYGADFYLQLIAANWKRITLFTLSDEASLAVIANK